jgi:predicted enzyme related to lactoylglutathione lyase
LLGARDLAATSTFYENLGFTLTQTAEMSLTVELEGGRMIFCNARLWEYPPQATVTFYFDLLSIEDIYERARNAGILRWDRTTTGYGGEEFAAIDPDGYTIALQVRTT